ncbi:MAG: hypothetical protein M0P61_06395 [Ignavibacteriaceae bacterium]|jgi:hypothetical protein|nr:hypothetical protein [Ignavibacteriaceae bacterium]
MGNSDPLIDKLVNLFETTRALLNSYQSIQEAIDNIEHQRLKDYLTEIYQTSLADLLILNDFLFETTTCIDENEVEFLIDCSTDDDNLEQTYQVN